MYLLTASKVWGLFDPGLDIAENKLLEEIKIMMCHFNLIAENKLCPNFSLLYSNLKHGYFIFLGAIHISGTFQIICFFPSNLYIHIQNIILNSPVISVPSILTL